MYVRYIFGYILATLFFVTANGQEKLQKSRAAEEINPLAEYSYSYQPRHVHLAYGRISSVIVVTWSTEGDANDTIVNWGESMFNLSHQTHGESKLFKDATGENIQYIHRVSLYWLPSNTTIFYQVGGPFGWSSVFGFKTVPAGSGEWPLRFAAFGDLGVVNAKSLTRLQKEAHTGKYDLILHVGDFAYDMYEDHGHQGDEFMSQIQPIAAYLPYMVSPGNHEYRNQFLQYRNRFSMPYYKDTENLYYSYDIGPVHFVSVSTEMYYFSPGMLKNVVKQWIWLEEDLSRAHYSKNHPWIIIYGHRPMYCSNANSDDCTKNNTRTRVGLRINDRYQFGMEKLINKYRVDLAIWAHEHSYERLYPIYDGKFYNDSSAYVNPKAPVHITTGSAGCREKHDHFTGTPPPHTAARFTEYGYARFTVFNQTHLHVEQINATSGLTLDEVTIVKRKPRSNQ